MPRTLAQGRRPTVRSCPELAYSQARRSAFPARTAASCTSAPRTVRPSWLQHLFRAAPLLRRRNGRLGESALAHSLALLEPFAKVAESAEWPFCQRLFSIFLFFLWRPQRSQDPPRLPLSRAASGPCSTVPPPTHASIHPLVFFPHYRRFLTPTLGLVGPGPPHFLILAQPVESLVLPASRSTCVFNFLLFYFFRLASPNRIRTRTESVARLQTDEHSGRALDSTRPSTRRDKTRQNNRRIVSRHCAAAAPSPLLSLLPPYRPASPYHSPPC